MKQGQGRTRTRQGHSLSDSVMSVVTWNKDKDIQGQGQGHSLNESVRSVVTWIAH